MRITFTGLASLVVLVAQLQLAHGAAEELRNDGFESGDLAGFQGGFVAGEIAAVRLEPPPGGPYQVTTVTLLFGGSAVTRDVTVKIYNDGGGVTPGGMIYEGDFTLTGSDSEFNTINLSGSNVFVAGPFRVGIEFNHNGLPSVARDNDGTILSSHNFILADGFGWVNSNLLGLTGDWVIRATIDIPGPQPDAGVPTPDASPGTPDASPDTPDASPNTPDAGPNTPDASPNTPDAGPNGEVCMVHSECPTGQYCSDEDVCTYDCRVDFDCGNDMRCTSLGMCEPTPPSGGCRIGGDDAGTPWGAGLLFVLVIGASISGRRRRERMS